MVPSYDILRTAAFFRDLLEFSDVLNTEKYVILSKDGLTVHILPAGNDIGQMEFYLEADDVDRIWSSIKGRLNGLKVREPFDRDYGMREIHLEIPSTKTLLFIGREIHRNRDNFH